MRVVESRGIWEGRRLCNIYSCMCMCGYVGCVHIPSKECLEARVCVCVCVCVCVLIDSLCAIFKPSLHPQPRGYLCLPAVCYLKGALKKHNIFCRETRARGRRTSHRIENQQRFSHLSLPHPTPLPPSPSSRDVLYSKPKHSEYPPT